MLKATAPTSASRTLPVHIERKVQSLQTEVEGIQKQFQAADSVKMSRMSDVYPTYYGDHELLKKILQHHTISAHEEHSELSRIRAAISDAKEAMQVHDEEEQEENDLGQV